MLDIFVLLCFSYETENECFLCNRWWLISFCYSLFHLSLFFSYLILSSGSLCKPAFFSSNLWMPRTANQSALSWGKTSVDLALPARKPRESPPSSSSASSLLLALGGWGCFSAINQNLFQEEIPSVHRLADQQISQVKTNSSLHSLDLQSPLTSWSRRIQPIRSLPTRPPGRGIQWECDSKSKLLPPGKPKRSIFNCQVSSLCLRYG